MMYNMPQPYMTGTRPNVTPYQAPQGQILQPPNPMQQQPEQQNPMMQMLQMQGMQKLMGQNQPPQAPQTSNPMSGSMPVGQQLPWQVNPGQQPGAQLPWQRPDFDPNATTGNASGGVLQRLLGGAGAGATGGNFFPSWLTSMFM